MSAPTWLLDSSIRLDDAGAVCLDDLRPVRRFDVSELKSPEETPAGFLRVEGNLTRVGVFTYKTVSGQTVRELRPASEVFKQDSLRSFDLVPLTLRHPPDNLTPETAAAHSVGTIGEPRAEPPFVRSTMLITRRDAIDAVRGGFNKLSAGYTTVVIPRSGTFVRADGTEERFDAVQTNIIGNHVAIVDNPRAGSEAQIRIDELDAYLIEDSKPDDRHPQRKDQTMKTKKVTIGEQTFEVPEEVAAALEAKSEPKADSKDDLKATVAELASKNAKLEGTIAAMQADAEKQKKEAEEKQRSDVDDARVNARIELIARCAPVLGKDVGEALKMDDAAIRSAVIAKLAPEVSIEGKDPAFVEGVFEHALSQVAKRVDTSAALNTLMGGSPGRVDTRQDDSRQKAEDARQRMMERNRNLSIPKHVREAQQSK